MGWFLSLGWNSLDGLDFVSCTPISFCQLNQKMELMLFPLLALLFVAVVAVACGVKRYVNHHKHTHLHLISKRSAKSKARDKEHYRQHRAFNRAALRNVIASDSAFASEVIVVPVKPRQRQGMFHISYL